MVFTSFNFLIFFPLLIAVYYATPMRYRWLTLLLVNYFFYANINPTFALLLAGITACTYVCTRLIAGTAVESKKKLFMQLNIFLILLPLFFFKYFNAINASVFSLLEMWHVRWPLPEIKAILPVGISFYTFMAIGYTIDVHNEEIECEKNVGMLALFLSFFPLILSGPIERADNMLPQFKAPRSFDYSMFSQGMKMMLWGYFMKLVVADRIGQYVDIVYGTMAHKNGTSLLFATLLYPFQLYADLGGYSLIAIGTASTLGFSVMHNFKRPFFSASMSEFWRRWHISFISWITDYVYAPLSFAFRGYKIWGIVAALMITFFLSGVWHGAALTNVVWGAIQGVFLSVEALTNRRRAAFERRHGLDRSTLYKCLLVATTYALFSTSEIFGRAETMPEAFLVLNKIFSDVGELFIGKPTLIIFICTGIAMVLLKDLADEFAPRQFPLFDNKNKAVRVASYSAICLTILLMGVLDGGQFIYFQF